MYIRYNLYLTVKVIKDTFCLERGDTESGLGLKIKNKKIKHFNIPPGKILPPGGARFI